MSKKSFWLPESISDLATGIDRLFYVELWLCVIVFIGVVGAMGYFIFKYRVTDTHQVAHNQLAHNNTLEITWTIIPTILVLILFYFGFKDFLKLSIPPKNTMEIRVTAKKWMWQFDYPRINKQTIGELVVPINRPIKLIMSSEDVIHSLYLPNLRIKRDVLPNRYTVVWFQAEKEGEYQIYCAEYCGDAHSNMLAKLKVLSVSDYEKWMSQSGGSLVEGVSLSELGSKLYETKGCISCHSIGSTMMAGPGWGGLYMNDRPLTDGEIVSADDNYLRESIVNPNEKVVRGFQPIMPTYSGMLNDHEINAIIEYIKTLKEHK